MLLASRSHDDLNVLTKSREKVHEALDGKGPGLASHEAGNMRLLDPQYLAGLCLSKPAVFDEPVDLQRQVRFELLTFRIGKAEISKDISATLCKSNSVFHHLSSVFLCSPAPQRRAAV